MFGLFFSSLEMVQLSPDIGQMINYPVVKFVEIRYFVEKQLCLYVSYSPHRKQHWGCRNCKIVPSSIFKQKVEFACLDQFKFKNKTTDSTLSLQSLTSSDSECGF